MWRDAVGHLVALLRQTAPLPTGTPPPSPRDLQCCLKVRQVRHRAPPRYTKCACWRTLTDHRSQTTGSIVRALEQARSASSNHVGRKAWTRPCGGSCEASMDAPSQASGLLLALTRTHGRCQFIVECMRAEARVLI